MKVFPDLKDLGIGMLKDGCPHFLYLPSRVPGFLKCNACGGLEPEDDPMIARINWLQS